MDEQFADYIPGSWFDATGSRIMRRVRGMSATAVKRARRWKNSIKGASITVATAFALGVSGVSLDAHAIATNQLDLPMPGLYRVAQMPAPDVSSKQMNASFAELFAAFRAGESLIANERTRALANKAAERREQRPYGWSKRLASDVEGADD